MRRVHCSLDEHCSVIKKAVLKTIQERQLKTPDIGGSATTTEFVRSVLDEIAQMTPTVGFDYQMQKQQNAFLYENID